MGMQTTSSIKGTGADIESNTNTNFGNNYDSQSTTTITSTGAGTTLTLDRARDEHTIAVVHEAGSSAHTVLLEGSIDGTNWFTIATLTGSATEDSESVGQPWLYVRYNVSTVGVGNTLTVQILSMSS